MSKPRILQVVGLIRPWAIGNRATALAAKLANDFEIVTVPYHAFPADWQAYDLFHFHTPLAVKCMVDRPEAAAGRPWGFELISVRSNGELPKWKAATSLAAYCVVKNPRLASAVAGLVQREPVWIPNGVDERRFYRGPFRVGWCGNKRPDSQEYKGVGMIQEAVNELAAEFDSVLRIEFVTDPGDAPRRMASPDEIAAWYRTLDCYVMASEGEGCSNTLLEAIASGLPVVTTRTGIVPELMDSCDVRIVDRHPGAIAEGLRRIVQPIAQRRRAILGGYTWKQVAGKYAELWTGALKGAGK